MDKTEGIRKLMVEEINRVPMERRQLEMKYGQVWDTQQLSADFEVEGFMAPLVVVRRKSDNARGSMMFQHSPRYYFSFDQV